MKGADITEWRKSRGWTVEEASVALGLPVSKLKALERAKTLRQANERLAKLLMAGYAMASLYERVRQNQQAIPDDIAKDRLRSTRKIASKK